MSNSGKQGCDRAARRGGAAARRGALRLGPPVGVGARREQQPRRARVPALRGLSYIAPAARSNSAM